MYGYKKDTRGSDNWTCTELKALPDFAKSEIADALDKGIKSIAWPLQMLLNLMALLGKPNGGDRTVSKTPMLYRMVVRYLTEFKEWAIQHSQEYDSAKRGSSALRAALLRNVVSEVAVVLGYEVATVFNDFEKFFDTMNVPTLLVESIFVDFPKVDLALFIQQHLAPRIIQCNGFAGDAINVYEGILPGCGGGIDLTRAYLMRFMVQLTEKHPYAPPKLHVDDESNTAVHKSWGSLHNIIAPCVLDYARGVKRLHLRLSPKGAIVSSNFKLTIALQREFKKHGIAYEAPLHTRDLGGYVQRSFAQTLKLASS